MRIRVLKRIVTLPETETDLAKALARLFGLTELEPDDWAHLSRESFVSSAVMPPNAKGFKDCVKKLQNRFKRTRNQTGKGRGKNPREMRTEVPQRLVPDFEWNRARYVSDYLAERASRLKSVRRLRNELLGRVLLSSEEALNLFESEAAGLLPLPFFRERGIPLANHTSRRELPDGRMPPTWSKDVSLIIQWPDGSVSVPYDEAWFFQRDRYGKRFQVPSAGGASRFRMAYPYSAFADIQRVVDSLRPYYPWSPAAIALFLLTGTAPPVEPITVETSFHRRMTHNFGSLTIRVQPWVSAKTLAAVYSSLRKRHYGKADHPLDPEKVELMRFTEKRLCDGRRTPRWNEIMCEWNRANKRRQYSSYAHFRREYLRASRRFRREVVYPRYKW